MGRRGMSTRGLEKGFCEHGYEVSVSVKHGEFFHQVRNYQFLNK